MKKIFFLLFSFFWAFWAMAQDDLQSLNDEFDNPKTLSNWKQFHEVEQFPDMIKKCDINQSKAGHLHLEPYTSGWYADFHAPFMFKEVKGNFDVRVRLKTSGTKTDLPQTTWSLAGLMIREPKKTTSQNWVKNTENWIFLTTGIAEPLGVPIFESKTTTNSGSNLKLRFAKNVWLEMRIVRIDGTFLLMYRYEGEKNWEIIERFYRPRSPEVLQVGLTAYTDFYSAGDLLKDPQKFNTTVVKDGKPDLILWVDYIRFQRPKSFEFPKEIALNPEIPYMTQGNLLSDLSVSNQKLLELLGE